MLPKINRLKSKDDFDIVKKKGKMHASESFGLLVLKSEKELKSGIIVSKKVFKNAVDRNKAKRSINRVLRNLLPEITEGFLLLFLVKKTIKEKDDSMLIDEIKNVFKKAGVIK